MASSRDHTKVEITSGQEKLVCRSSWCVYSMCVHLGREESWPEVEKELTARAFALGPQLVILFSEEENQIPNHLLSLGVLIFFGNVECCFEFGHVDSFSLDSCRGSSLTSLIPLCSDWR